MNPNNVDPIDILEAKINRNQRMITRTLAATAGLALGLSVANYLVLKRHDAAILDVIDAVDMLVK